MAFIPKTINEIYTDMLVEKNNLTTLTALTDNGIIDEATLISKINTLDASEWSIDTYNSAVQHYLTEIRMKLAIDEITALAINNIHDNDWYVTRIKKFQLDDTPFYNDLTGEVEYSVIDTAKQIVDSVTILEFTSKLICKVKRKDTNVLTAGEKAQLIAYINKFKDAGTQVLIESLDGDLLSLYFTVIYSGIYSQPNIQASVESAINTYLVNLEFNSDFKTNKLVDQLQVLTGIEDIYVEDGNTATDANLRTTPFKYLYQTTAGWCQINPATPLSTTINYIYQ